MKVVFCALLLAFCLGPGRVPAQAAVLADSTRPTTKRLPAPNSLKASPAGFVRYKWDVSIDPTFLLPAFYSMLNVSTFGPPNSPNYANVAGGTVYGYTTGASRFDASQVRSARFLVRKNETVYSPTNVPLRQGAYRFSATLGGGAESARIDTVFFPGTSGLLITTATSSWNARGQGGYEWQHQLGRFQGYYGYELALGYVRYSQTVRVVNSAQGRTSPPVDITDRTLFAEVSAVAGVKFFVHPRVSLGLEAAYAVTGFRRAYDGLLPADFSKQRYQAQGVYANLMPLSAVNATFHFGEL